MIFCFLGPDALQTYLQVQEKRILFVIIVKIYFSG